MLLIEKEQKENIAYCRHTFKGLLSHKKAAPNEAAFKERHAREDYFLHTRAASRIRSMKRWRTATSSIM